MCGFRKGLSTHQCLLALLEKWKREIDNGEIFGDLLTTYQKHLIVSTTNFPLQSLMNMVSAYQYSNQFRIILIGNK